MGATQLITVSNTAWTVILAQSDCRQVTIGEDASVNKMPTTDWLIAKPGTSNTPRRIAGSPTVSYTFVGPFTRGSIVGYVQIVKVGSTSFYQDEA